MIVGQKHQRASRALNYIVLLALSSYCLFPLVWMIDTAFKPVTLIHSRHPGLLIATPTLKHFVYVLFQSDVPRYFLNSIIVSTSTTILALCVSVFGAYAISRWGRFTMVELTARALVISQMIPGVLLLIPLYIIMQRLGLLSTYEALIVTYCTFAIPLCVFLLRNFFDAIPRDLEEAAELDGCKGAQFILRILLPLSVPGLLSTGMFVFVTSWNEFMFGYVLINDQSHRPLTPGILIFQGSHVTHWGDLMAASTIAVVPVALCFIWLQRYLMEGLTVGAVKG